MRVDAWCRVEITLLMEWRRLSPKVFSRTDKDPLIDLVNTERKHLSMCCFTRYDYA